MKVTLIVSAAFAVVAAAAAVRGRDDVGPSPATNTTIVGGIELEFVKFPNGAGWYPPGRAQLALEHHELQTLQPAAGPTKPDEPLNSFTVRVDMSNIKQNMGKVRGSDLYNIIYQGLHELCPEGRGECFTPDEKKVTFAVDYVRNKKLMPGTATIFLAQSRYDGPGTRDIRNARRRLMIGTIAAAYEQQSMDMKNCWDDPDVGLMCNVGGGVHVNIEGEDFIWARVDASTNQGHFDCVATAEAVSNKVKDLLPEYQINYHGADINGLAVECPFKDVT